GDTDGGAGTGGSAGASGGASGADAAVDGPPDPFPPPPIPDAIAVPTGATLKFRAHGRGSQVYTCTATTAAADGGTDAGATTYGWVLKAPDAKLYDQNDALIGTHFAGPTWMSTVDESDAVGSKVQQANGATANDIPVLLLKVVSHMGTGVFTDVTYVQRLLTMGGVAPATGCDATTVGTDQPVAYSADYYFYTGGVAAADGGTAAQWPFVTIASVPDAIAAPAGTTLKLRLHGWGDQVYTCTPSGGADAGADAGATTYAWVLKAPAANLYDDTDTKQGTHSAGPTWTANDTSSIVGMKLFQASGATANDVPWLLLKVASHAGATGTFTDVTYVQRLNTSKGVAPATGCDAAHANTDLPVSYSADYYFYTGTPADGGAD
ncbi:MAG TPA: DUF3455 domain-containing protein, partial [Polyangia bacterium]|nr:DUF3455 domain-containing protein [Polyangia bacterium]